MDTKLLAIVEKRFGASGEEECGEEFGNGEVVLSVCVAAHAAREGGAVGGEQRKTVSGLLDRLETFDDGSNHCSVESRRGAEAVVEEELWGCGIQRSEGRSCSVGG
jgi:hypothetical protein